MTAVTDPEATISALLAANDALEVLLRGVTKERDELKATLRTVRKSIIDGVVPEIILGTLGYLL